MNAFQLNYGVNSEYKSLRAVLLFIPEKFPKYKQSPENVLHKHQIDYEILKIEHTQLIKTFQSLKITTYFIDSAQVETEAEKCLFNLMYTRDLAWMTPRGAIIGRMGSEVRREETKYAEKALRALSIPIIATVEGEGTFEGADAIWLSESKVLIGVGNRTNDLGFIQVESILKKQDIHCIPIPLKNEYPQHLLGVIQIIDSDFAMVRSELVNSWVRKALRENGFKILEVPESLEVRERQAMNIVALNRKRIIMPLNSPSTKALYQSAGIEVLAEVPIEQLINGWGGIACATLPLCRKW